MTATAEERAKAVLAFLASGCGFDACVHPDCPSCGCLAYIAQALRQAQNDKLEEAARLMDRVMADSKAALIRTLKRED